MLTPPNVPTDHAAKLASILVIDPEPLYRWFVTESLGACGMAVMAAASIEGGAAYLSDSGSLDLLIVDGDLFLSSGQLRCMLRECAGATPFLVLDSDGDLTRQEFGTVTVAAKPVDSAALARLVTSQLRPGVPRA